MTMTASKYYLSIYAYAWHQRSTFSFTNVKKGCFLESLPTRKCCTSVPTAHGLALWLITKLLRLFRGHQGNKPLKSQQILRLSES